MREMKDSGVEWMKKIPLSWKTIRFRYLHTSSNVGDSVDKSQYSNDEEGHVFYMAGKEPITTSYERFPAWKYTNHNDLLMARNGTPYVYLPVENAVYSDHVIRVDIKKGYDRRYVRYCLQQSIEAEVVETVSIPTWSISLWDEQNIPVPPFHEQCHVADFLDSKCAEIDALSADIQSEIETLEAYKRSVITEAVTKGLDKNALMKDSGTQWLGCIPAHWNISRIGSVYKLRNTKVSDKDYGPLSVTMKGVVPQLDSAAKTNAHDDRKLVKEGDFVINSRSDRRGSCGISPIDGSVSLINTVLAPLDEMNPEYYDWLFHTAEFADEFYKCGHGIVDDLWTTGWQDMKRILISYPPLEEQANIAEYLNDMCSDIDAIIAQKQEQLAVLADYKKSIIYEYVTGKKEVPVA